MPTTLPPRSAAALQRPALPASLGPWLAVAALIAAMTLMRLVYAASLDLRTDEAYYWTWSKESALSFLDHPPMIAWFIRFGTAIFGDTALGVRFAGIVAMLVTQLLLADIVRRVTHDARAVIFALLMPEAALYYGLLMAKVAPDTALIPFAVAMLWSLVRFSQSGDGRWWLAAGGFAGLALLSKFTAIMLLPAVLAFMLVPDWRWRMLKSPWPWAAALIALVIFSPVLIWNAQHDWASFRFQLVRAVTEHPLSLRTLGEFFSLQFGLVGFVLLPVVLSGVTLTAWRGARSREPVAILLSTAVIVPFLYFLWKSLTLRVGDTWPMFLWPAGFAATAINFTLLAREKFPDWMVQSTIGWIRIAIATGIAFVVGVFFYYVAAPWNFIGRIDPVGGEAGYEQVVAAARNRVEENQRDLDRDHGLSHLCDAALAFQRPAAGDPDQRARPLPGLCRSRHGMGEGPPRPLCRALAGREGAVACRHHGGARTAWPRRACLARRRDGFLHIGKDHRLDTGARAAKGVAAVPLARAGGHAAGAACHADSGPR